MARKGEIKYIIEPELLWSLYWGEGHTLDYISILFGCDSSLVSIKMKQSNIPRRDRFEAHKSKYEMEEELLWGLYYGNQYSVDYISKLMNCGCSCVDTAMRKYDIPRRRGQFNKGNVPWNKDTIGVMKPNSTSFQVGLIPWNKGITGEDSHSWKDGGFEHICPNCGNIFKTERRNAKFCSVECRDKFHNNGLTQINMRIRKSKRYDEWRHSIFERDNWTCQQCGDRCGYGYDVVLNAHHIIPFAEIMRKSNISTKLDAMNYERLWDLDNGVTLCKRCHDILHGKKV